MTGWTQLLATALVGTDRRPSDVDTAGVLDRAAGWAVYRRAGALALSGVAPPSPAPAETAPVVGRAAGRRLFALLAGEMDAVDGATRAALLEEWLTVAAARGRRVPPAVLPELLDYGRYHAGLRDRITAVGGARARWLAAQNGDWRYLTAVESTSDDAEQWNVGTPGERIGYLRGLRHRDPTAARELLEREWSSLTPDERDALVAVLEDGLGPADEPLLERALDDRRAAVREAAARLLAALPGSAYADRMTRRARAAIAVSAPADAGGAAADAGGVTAGGAAADAGGVTAGGAAADAGGVAADAVGVAAGAATRSAGPSVTAVSLPVECDAGMRRDGITPKPPSGVGERAWWLEEILARTPLSTWPVGLSVGASATEWAPTIHRGLARAAAAERDPVWAAGLLDRLGDDARERAIATALYPVLSPDELAGRAVAALRQGRSAVWGALLAACPPPWPDRLARAALAGIAALAGRPELRGELHRLCRLAAVRISPVLAPELEESTVDAIDQLAMILHFRHEMIREIA